jgi:hypothetical protein
VNQDPPDATTDDPDECVIPPPLVPSIAGKFALDIPEHERRDVIRYVELESNGEEVVRLEKIKTERLYGRTLDAWDVQTDKDRYWVITNPTNLYSQTHFPSLDYTLSFHVGLMERVHARQRPEASEEEADRLAVSWRRWTLAADALDRADEVEDFQAVGVRCRETLIALTNAVATPEMVPPGKDPPKGSAFVE